MICDFKDIIISQHIVADRMDRVRDIMNNGGLGEPKMWLESKESADEVHILTTTDVILVVYKHTKFCPTLYRANKKQLYNFNLKAHPISEEIWK